MRREKRNVALQLNKKHVFPRAATGGGAAAAVGVPRGAGVAPRYALPPGLHHTHDRHPRQQAPPRPSAGRGGRTAKNVDLIHELWMVHIYTMICIKPGFFMYLRCFSEEIIVHIAANFV